MTPAHALAFIERHGIVCEASRRGAIGSLVDEIAGETVRGSWWSHPRSRAIFAATRAVRDSSDVLVCRVVDGKITFVHRRLWPGLVRVADRFEASRLSRLHEIHSASGKHVIERTPFPDWVPPGALASGKRMSEANALAQLQILFGKKEM